MSTGEQKSDQENQMDSLRSRMKVQRVYNSANTLSNLADSLLSNMNDNREIVVDNEEMDKLNEEIQSLQDRLIEAVKTATKPA